MDESKNKTSNPGERGIFSPVEATIGAVCLLNEIIDWAGSFFNISGVWVIVVLILNLLTLFLVLCWRMMTEGFSLSAIFGTWKQAIWLILEHIPVVGDLIPGWLLWLLEIRKKKKPTPAPT